MKKITIFNLPQNISFQKDNLEKALEKVVSSQFKLQNISIIFVLEEEILRLNKEFRKKNEITDVLSFNYDTQELLGEVYVCPKYILKQYKEEEILRAIIHGILHLYGYDHKGHFVDTKEENIENIFVIQETLLNKLKKRIS